MPKRIGNLLDTVASVENLWGAWRDFRRGKRSRPSVREADADADRTVLALHRELSSGTYRPGDYRLFMVHAPKRRLIAAASVRDRIVHHAVHRVIAPRLDRRLIDTTYACLPGRGSHRAILRYQQALRRHRHVLMLDVRHYFPSVDRNILHRVMAARTKDPGLLALLQRIAQSGAGIYTAPEIRACLGLAPERPDPGRCGLPIGNLTSQWWGNHYLCDLDHFAKRELKIPHYQRYMDDLTLFADSRRQLEDARQAVGDWLQRERGLRLKDPRAPVRRATATMTYLGYTVSRAAIRPSAGLLARARKRLRRHVVQGTAGDLTRSIESYRGLVGWMGG